MQVICQNLNTKYKKYHETKLIAHTLGIPLVTAKQTKKKHNFEEY